MGKKINCLGGARAHVAPLRSLQERVGQHLAHVATVAEVSTDSTLVDPRRKSLAQQKVVMDGFKV